VRTTPELKAAAERRSVSAWIELLLIAALEKLEKKKP
jgi:hypothetical protein